MKDKSELVERVAEKVLETKADKRLRIAIGIATVRSSDVLCKVLNRISRQTRLPDATILCTPEGVNLDELPKPFSGIRAIQGPRGSSHQRNAIVKDLTGFDVVLFLDDDFVPRRDYVARLEALMLARADIVIATGTVLQDGAVGPGLTFDQADQFIANDEATKADDEMSVEDVFNGYGCNMAVRLAPVRDNSVVFDERLPLYAWLEDVDFSRQLAPSGRIVKATGLRGVHLGVKSGRQVGYRLGYSQIANPVFLIGKGTCTVKKGLFLMSRNVLANLIKSLRPEPWVDRTGRLCGNMRALFELLTGRLRPDRILDL